MIIAAVSDFNQQLIISMLCTVVVPFVIQYLRAAAEHKRQDAAKAGVQRKTIILDQVEGFVFDAAANIAEKRFPILAKKVVAGELTNSAQVHEELKSWGEDLKGQATEFFSNQGVDIAKEVGTEGLDKMIETAANRVSPFPGMETAKTLLKDQVAPMLAEKGVDYVRGAIFNLVEGKKPIDQK